MKRSTLFGFVIAGFLGGASMGIVACADQGGEVEAQPDCVLPADAVSPELLAFLSKARASHVRADLAMKDENTEVAIAALDELVDGSMPGGPLAPEAREVLADTLARSAELRSTIGQFDEAKADITRGLKLAPELTHYRGRLMEVLGAVESRLHEKILDDIAAQQDAGADSAQIEALEKRAEDAKQRAILASMEAIDIQEDVINRALLEEPIEP